MTSLTSGHCCACTVVCGHIGGPWFCARHEPKAAAPMQITVEPTSPGWYDAALKIAHDEAAKLRADVERLSGLAGDRLVEIENLHRRIRAQEAAIEAVGEKLDATRKVARELVTERNELKAEQDRLFSADGAVDPLDIACAIEFFDEHGQPVNAAAVRGLVVAWDGLADTVRRQQPVIDAAKRFRELRYRTSMALAQACIDEIYAAVDALGDAGQVPA